MSEYGGDPDLRVSRGRPPGLTIGVLAGGLVGVVLVARTARVAVIAAVVLAAVALLVPLALSRRTTVMQGDRVTSWGVRGRSSARSVSLAQLTEVRYRPGGRGPARLRLRDESDGRLSIPLPSTGPERAQLLSRVADAAVRRGLTLDPRTRSRLGTDLDRTQ